MGFQPYTSVTDLSSSSIPLPPRPQPAILQPVEGYTVIARRWRPKRFEELVGQESIVRALSNAVAAKRIAHAYLFVGPRGTGKTSTPLNVTYGLNPIRN